MNQEAEIYKAAIQFLLRVDLKGSESRAMTLCQEFFQHKLNELDKSDNVQEKKPAKAPKKTVGRKQAKASNGQAHAA